MCLAGPLIGGVGGLCVLLLISVSINIVAIIYQLSVRRTQSAGGSAGRENEEQLYEQVDDHHPGIVAMKQNEAYGEIGTPNPSHITGV